MLAWLLCVAYSVLFVLCEVLLFGYFSLSMIVWVVVT